MYKEWEFLSFSKKKNHFIEWGLFEPETSFKGCTLKLLVDFLREDQKVVLQGCHLSDFCLYELYIQFLGQLNWV